MTRILISPKAYALALHLLDVQRRADPTKVTFSVNDNDVADQLGLKPDTVYRAFAELNQLGALQFEQRDTAGNRVVSIPSSHWVYSAVTEQGARW